MKSYKSIKKRLCYFPLLNNLITQRSINIHKKEIAKIEKIYTNSGLRFVSPIDFKYINPANYSHCNIWGSGYSASESVKNKYLIKDSFDIGFGYSYLLNLEFDFYFIENASPSFAKIVNLQKKGINEMINLEKCKLIFKNIWQEKNNINYAINEYKDMAFFSRDIVVPHYLQKKRIFEVSAKYLLLQDDFYFRQSCSSILLSIIFAKYLGFNKIIIHGVDFGGKYFFDLPEFEHFSSYRPESKNSQIYNKKWRSNDSKHPTGNCLKSFLPIFKRDLNHLNINLYSATEKSPLNKILPLYE